jgi:hypothetical protein
MYYYQPYENLPWNELVRKTIDQAYEWWFQQLITLISLCAEHLTDSTFVRINKHSRSYIY